MLCKSLYNSLVPTMSELYFSCSKKLVPSMTWEVIEFFI
nr:MAG TPA: hypothetical protein [Caudoviricetes sp.]